MLARNVLKALTEPRSDREFTALEDGMVVYQVAQLGAGWAIFRIEGTRLEHVDGPYRSRRHALARKRLIQRRETRGAGLDISAGAPAYDD